MATFLPTDDGRPVRVRMTARPQPPTRYEIRVRGILDERWSAWFDDLTVRRAGDDETLIAGVVSDQAALHGLLTKINDLGLVLVSVHRVDEGTT